MKKALIALAMLLSMGAPSYAQTAGQAILGFLLAQGSTYNGYTCPAAATSPCFVQYGSSLPTAGGGGGGSTVVTNAGTFAVQNNAATPAGTNSIGTVVETSSTYVSTSALAANQIIVTGAHKLLSFQVSADTTLSGAAWWLMIYDATTAPGDGAVTPAKCIAFPSGTTGYTGAYFSPVSFTTGIVIGVSTTGCFTKTASTHAFISGDYQ